MMIKKMTIKMINDRVLIKDISRKTTVFRKENSGFKPQLYIFNVTRQTLAPVKLYCFSTLSL